MWRTLPAALFLLVEIAPCQAQQEGPPRMIIRVESRRVVVDVLVFDAEGKFVSDLTSGDFQVLENGTPRQVTNLILIDKDSPEARDLSRLPPGQRENYQDLWVVVLDRVSTGSLEFARSLKALEEAFAELPGNTSAALFVYNGDMKLVQPFTDRSHRLQRALEVAGRTLPIRRLPSRAEITEELGSLFNERLPLGFTLTDSVSIGGVIRSAMRDAIHLANRYLTRADRETQSFFRNMENLLRSLRYVSGNKNLLLFSGGYSLLQGEDFTELLREQVDARFVDFGTSFRNDLLAQAGQVAINDYHQNLVDLVGTANQNQIRVYTVEPGGLRSLSPTGDIAVGTSFYQLLTQPDRALFRDIQRLSEPIDSLVSLALETNGLPFYNRNDLSRAFSMIQEHNSRYYLLGYDPTPQRKEGKYYDVEVRVNRPDLKVFAERGYRYNRENRDQKSLEYALAYPGLYRQIPVEAGVSTLYDKQGPLTLISLEMPGARVPFLFKDGYYNCRLNIYGFFLDDSGKEVERFQVPYTLNLTPEEYDQFRNKSFIYYQESRLNPGDYQFRALVQDDRSRQIGADLRELSIPRHDSRLALSDLVLSQDVREWANPAAGPAYHDSYRVVPEGDRAVRLGEPLFVHFQVLNLARRGTGTDGLVRLELLDPKGTTLYASEAVPVRDQGAGAGAALVTRQVPIADLDLAAGHYLLRVEVKDRISGSSLTEQIEIEFLPRAEAGE